MQSLCPLHFPRFPAARRQLIDHFAGFIPAANARPSCALYCWNNEFDAYVARNQKFYY
jgi:hypothetical protein